MSRKYHVGEVISLESAILLQKLGLAVAITDGKYVQLEKEDEEN